MERFIENATGRYHVSVLSYYHSFSLFGRSAKLAGLLPYAVGTFQGSVLGTQRQAYRSGLFDVALRFSVNLKGGPAMAAPEFDQVETKGFAGNQPDSYRSDWSIQSDAPHQLGHQSMGLQTGIRLFATLGQLGTRWLRGVWFYTKNNASFSIPNPQPQTQSPSVPSRVT